MVITKTYTEPPVCKKEILRYAGCKDIGKEAISFEIERQRIELLLEECLMEVLPKLSYKVCYLELPVSIIETTCDFGCMKFASQDLAKNLQGCEKVLLFAATIGVEIDRLIMKYGAVSPAKAMMFQAIGAERIESLCDIFCETVQQESDRNKADAKKACNAENTMSRNLRPRFSPGYGDLSLETQKDIFQILGCSKNIGLSLNGSLLMSPSKSVTAFVGMSEVIHGITATAFAGSFDVTASELAEKDRESTVQQESSHNCAICNKTDCAYKI